MSKNDKGGPGRKPPRGRPFQPGRSGNPSGRRPGSISSSTALRKVMSQPTAITIDGKQITVPRTEAMWQKLSIMVLEGDLGAARIVTEHMAKLEPSVAPGPAVSAVDLAAAAAIIAAHDQDVLAVHGVKPESSDGR